MSAEEQQRVKYELYDIKEFPLVLGAVDGTLIPIKAPSVDEDLNVSRKGYHAINIQCVCDANYMVRDIVGFIIFKRNVFLADVVQSSRSNCYV
jgi:hypothetical protein